MTLVGVHIRRTDYKSFLKTSNVRLFEADFFVNAMQTCISQLHLNGTEQSSAYEQLFSGE
jgi:hypothetical protein